MGKGAAESVVLDLADESGTRSEGGEANDGIGRRATGHFQGRAHGVIDRLRTRLVDQRHRAFVHALLEQKIFFGAGDDIDDRIADAENVETSSWHDEKTLFGENQRAGRAL